MHDVRYNLIKPSRRTLTPSYFIDKSVDSEDETSLYIATVTCPGGTCRTYGSTSTGQGT